MAPGSGVVSIAAGQDFVFAIKKDGSVWAWGDNNARQMGNLEFDNMVTGRTSYFYRSPFHLLSVRSGMVRIVAGGNFALASGADGSVWGWGNNEFAQLGDLGDASQWPPAPLHEQVLGGGVIELAAGGSHSLALMADGSVWAWGNNNHGQLGNGKTPLKNSLPTRILNSGVVAIAAGSHHSLALKADGSVWAWGRNNGGQLGDGTTASKPAPVQVLTPGSGVVAVAAAGNQSLALKADGSVWQWGDRWKDPDAAASATAKLVPTRVPALSLSDGEKR